MISTHVYPFCVDPTKFQIEQCFDIVEPNLITAKIIDDFGLEQRDSRWVVTATLAKARKFFPSFYESLPKKEKLLFQTAYLNSGVEYMRNILSNLDQAGVETADLCDSLNKFHSLAVGTIVRGT